MSLRLTGWVECKNPVSQWFFDEWVPVINLDPLLDDDEEVHRALPFTSRLPEGAQRLAPGCRLPGDVSPMVAQEAGQWNVPWYASWLTWAELEPVRSRSDLPADWQLLMKMVEPLAAICGKEGIRVIVWEYVTGF